MSKLTIPLLAAMLLTSAPALAAGLVLNDPHADRAAAKTADTNDCALNLSIPSHISAAQFVREGAAFDRSSVDNRWASGAAYQWNAGVNRAVDRLLMPPDRVQFYVTQTGEDWRGNSEGDKSPNRTFAAFEVVLH